MAISRNVLIGAGVVAAVAIGLAVYLAPKAIGIGRVSEATAPSVNTGRERVAVKGYDVVAYFTENRAALGSPDHVSDWNGATWQFASAEHADLFAAAPEQYAPQYGGYCAIGLSDDELWTIDPEAWVIVDGKLYLNYDKRTRDDFIADPEEAIAKANQAWTEKHLTN